MDETYLRSRLLQQKTPDFKLPNPAGVPDSAYSKLPFAVPNSREKGAMRFAGGDPELARLLQSTLLGGDEKDDQQKQNEDSPAQGLLSYG